MLDWLIHLEQLLPTLLENYGIWIYAILFLIIFAETASVFMFFLPGDSLLIAIGALCYNSSSLNLSYMVVLLVIAAILGYVVNYYTGRVLGFKFFHQHSRIFKPKYITKTNHYFLKHGGKTIMIARFIPFVRSFAPFAAGAAHMNKTQFMLYNIVGAGVWIVLLLGIGYGAGNLLSFIFEII